MNEDQFEVQAEMLELIVKAGRRLMHDFDHLLAQVPKDEYKLFEERAKHWRSIFYPDNGPKNYRAALHLDYDILEMRFSRAVKQLKDNGLEFDDGNPF